MQLPVNFLSERIILMIALDQIAISQPTQLNHLQALEAESIAILREAVAEFAQAGDVVLDWERLFGDAAAGAEGFLSRQDSVSAAACRYELQVS